MHNHLLICHDILYIYMGLIKPAELGTKTHGIWLWYRSHKSSDNLFERQTTGLGLTSAPHTRGDTLNLERIWEVITSFIIIPDWYEYTQYIPFCLATSRDDPHAMEACPLKNWPFASWACRCNLVEFSIVPGRSTIGFVSNGRCLIDKVFWPFRLI